VSANEPFEMLTAIQTFAWNTLWNLCCLLSYQNNVRIFQNLRVMGSAIRYP